jgi:16S rRNA processing protein RimM
VVVPKLIVMGRVIAPFGVKGWIKIEPFTEAADGLGQFPFWWIGRGEDWSEFRLAESARHGSVLVARLEGCEGRDAAAKFRGSEIAVPREALPPSGESEFYQADLIGMEVRNLEDERLGSVAGFLGTGAHHPVMCLAGEEGERLLPFIPSVVKLVDTGAGRILVDWGKDW